MRIERRSRITGVLHARGIAVTEEQLTRWQRGELIQDVAPDLSSGDREFIISGITPEEWAAVFGDE